MLDEREWEIADLDGMAAPRLVVVIDAEEEFDWSAPFSRAHQGVANIAHQHLAHRIFDRFGIVPTYMVDYPVASQPEGWQPLADLLADGRCGIGAQLHPWVTPPFTEEVTVHNSFAGNLPPELEHAKLGALVDAIATNLGGRPTMFTAGRYGVGPATRAILEALGFRIDSSVVPHTEYLSQGGPDFRHCGARPYWVGPGRRLLELPRTVGLVGRLARRGRPLFDSLSGPVGRRLRLPGLFARSGLIERIALTPEGITHAEHRRLTEAMLAAGHRVFVFSYHSPSLVPGNTPYVTTENELQRFLDAMTRYFDWFIGEIGGRPATPEEIWGLVGGGGTHRNPATTADRGAIIDPGQRP